MIDVGNIFAHMMHFYHLSDGSLMEMPVRRFWFLYGQISRISAINDIRTIQAHSAIHGGKETHQKTMEALREEMGTIIIDNTFDEAGSLKLKALAG